MKSDCLVIIRVEHSFQIHLTQTSRRERTHQQQEMTEENDKVASSSRCAPTEAFISEEDFQYLAEVKEAGQEALGWSLLPQNIIYEISSLSTLLQDQDEKIYWNYLLKMERKFVSGALQTLSVISSQAISRMLLIVVHI